MELLNNRYKIEKILSEKGVFISRDGVTGRKVLIKCQGAEESSNFEYDILKKVNHEYMPLLTDSFISDGNFYFVENFIEGITLDEYIKKNPDIDFDEILGIAVMTGRLIKYLHTMDRPIIHGDINPRNILINERNQIFLVDFSSSIFLEYILYKDIREEGTANFFPPEKILLGKSTGFFSDIYGLGALIEYMIKESGKIMGLELSAIAKKGMEIKPDKRYLAIEEFLRHMEAI